MSINVFHDNRRNCSVKESMITLSFSQTISHFRFSNGIVTWKAFYSHPQAYWRDFECNSHVITLFVYIRQHFPYLSTYMISEDPLQVIGVPRNPERNILWKEATEVPGHLFLLEGSYSLQPASYHFTRIIKSKCPIHIQQRSFPEESKCWNRS